MRTTALTSLVLALCLAGAAAAQAPIQRGRAVAPDAAIRVFNLAGTVRVRAWERDSVDVTAVVPKGAGELLFGGGYSGVKLGMNPPVGEATFPGALLEVRVPAGARLWVKSESAEVLVSGLTGSVDLSTMSGRIVVTGSPSQLTAETMDGGIDAEVNSALVRLKSAGGAIALRGAVTDASISTVGGAATAHLTNADRVLMEAVGGSLSLDAAPRHGGNYTLTSHSGDIAIRLPAEFDAALDLTALEGKVVNHATKRMATAANKGKGESLYLVGGQGASDVVARTFRGTITVSVQTAAPAPASKGGN